MNIAQTLHHTLSQFPEGLTAMQLASLHPDINWVNSQLNQLVARGLVEKRGKEPREGRPSSTVFAACKPYSAKAQVGRKQGPRARVSLAAAEAWRERIKELEEWKGAAIRRYPDLAVSPVVLKARKLAAAHFPDKAGDIHQGVFDNKPLIRLVALALEETID